MQQRRTVVACVHPMGCISKSIKLDCGKELDNMK